MELPDLDPLNRNYDEYEKKVETVTERFKCEWEDSVHDSYKLYLEDIEEFQHNIGRIRDLANELLNDLDIMDVDQLISETESLCGRDESI